jgi:hypothetical protein
MSELEAADLPKLLTLHSPKKMLLQLLYPDLRERRIFYDEFAVYDRPSLFYAWAERNSKSEVSSNEKRKRNKST